MSDRVIVSLSGGMDSATVLASAVKRFGRENVEAIGFWYGSKHNPYETACAKLLTEYYNVLYDNISVSSVFYHFSSALMDRDVPIPEGHYEQENMKLTVVPNRNMIFLSILTGLAISRGINEIWVGVHAGDHAIYPDCRPEFIAAAKHTLRIATATNIELIAPFLYLKKVDILRTGFDLGVPYEHTRTCYQEELIACGRCGSCVERLSAFHELGKEDPLEYEDREFYKQFLLKDIK